LYSHAKHEINNSGVLGGINATAMFLEKTGLTGLTGHSGLAGRQQTFYFFSLSSKSRKSSKSSLSWLAVGLFKMMVNSGYTFGIGKRNSTVV